MDLFFVLHGQHFVWNHEKGAGNLAKHGISFEQACEVFFDPFLRIQDATDDEEQRDAVVGLTEDWSLLFVVHIVRERDLIRIISARPATPQERKSYEDAE